MKKLVFIFLGLLILFVAALGVFLATFNADSYRPFIQQKLQEALKLPVEIGRISLGWNGGFALELEGVKVLQSENSKENLVSLRKASIQVNARPLLKRELQVSSIILENPEIDFVQGGQKPITVSNPDVSTAGGASSAGVEAAAAGVISFFVNDVKIQGGRLRYLDASVQPAVEIAVSEIDGTVRNISLLSAMDFEGRAAVFSASQNVDFSGKLHVRSAQEFEIKNLKISADMRAMDTARILKSLPALQTAGLAQGLEGRLEAVFSLMKATGGKLSELEGSARGEVIRFKTAAMPLYFEKGSFESSFSLNHISIRQFQGWLGSSEVVLSGLAQNLQAPQPESQVDFSISRLSLAELAPPASQSAPSMEGEAAFNARVGALGKSDAEILATLGGQARLTLQNGVLRNMNVVREILNKLSMIPGVSKSLNSRLPENYQQKLNERDTFFLPVEIPVTVRDGAYFFDQALIQSELFAIRASGRGDVAGNLQGEASLVIEPQMSYAMIAGINELRTLADGQGQLQVPLILRSDRGQFSVTPNVSFIVSRLAAAKTQEVLANLLTKKNQTATDPNAPQQSAPTSPLSGLLGQNSQQNSFGGQTRQPQQQQGLGGGLLGQLLSSALQGQTSNGDSSQS